MPFFQSLGADGAVRDILKMNPAAGKALIDYHSAVLRQPSALSEGERELIAAYVSGLNACQYCHGVHTVTAETYGIPSGLLSALLNDIDSAPIDPRLKPLLHFVDKLTHNPARLIQADADAVFAAGWDEQALHDAINVACLFNFMNRLVDGHGIKGHSALYHERGQQLQAHGYRPLLKAIGFEE